MSAFPVLSSERLTLRPPEPRDLPAYIAFYTDADATAWYGGRLRVDQVWRRMAEDIGHWHLRGFGLWMLVRKDDGRVIGGAGLHHPEGWPRHELTWWLLPHSRGTGYAAEASRTIIEWALDSLGWDRVETHIRDGNRAAHRLAVRLGGQVIARELFPDGYERDIYCLATTDRRATGHGPAEEEDQR